MINPTTMKNPILLITLFITISCNSGNSETLGLTTTEADFENLLMVEPSSKTMSASQEAPNDEFTHKVIKTGGIEFETENIEKDYQKIKSILPKYGAYIENENQSKSSHQINYNLTVRVPAPTYDTLFSSVVFLAKKVINKYSNQEDVTERYYDLETRIKNKKALETTYVELLKKASEIKDILDIERNLNQVRTDIERLEGQFRYLSKQVSYSTINLNFYEQLPYTYDNTNRPGFVARILKSLDRGWQGFLSFLIWLIGRWPFIIITTGLVVLFRMYRRKKKNPS